MLHVTVPNMPETLTYAVLASLGIDLVIALFLVVRGDWLGVLLVLALLFGNYASLCRARAAVVSATSVAGASAIVLLLCALVELVAGSPYYGILFIAAAAVIAFVYLLLQQGTVPADLRVGGIEAVGGGGQSALLRMLEELRDAGVLSAEEFAVKRATLGL